MFPRRLLQQHQIRRCTYHRGIISPSFRFRNYSYTSQNILGNLLRGRTFSEYNNLQNAATKSELYHHDAHDDDYCEPEYLELVSETANRMRLAVREYVSQYSGLCSKGGIVDGNKSKDFTNAQNATCSSGPPPIKLVGILATTTPQPIKSSDGNCNQHRQQSYYENDTHGNEKYSEQISASCLTDGIIYEPWRVPPTREALERAIHHANERLDVHGILVFYPVFDKLTTNIGDAKDSLGTKTYKCQETGVYYKSIDDYFRDLVACSKDVEGYCRKGLLIQRSENLEKHDTREENLEHIVRAEELGPIYPCTALAVYNILKSFHLSNQSPLTADTDGRKLFDNITITIINRSEVLGLPLAIMLSNQGATVYSINIDSIWQFLPSGKVRREHSTTTVELCVKRSSVIVSGVPSNTFKVPTEWIPKNATVINVAAETNFDEETICDETVGITYVPHVGRVTVAALEYNLMSLHKNYHSEK